MPVEVREWIIPALSSPDLVLELQPPAQPHRCVAVECPIRLADGAYFEVVRPFASVWPPTNDFRSTSMNRRRCHLTACLKSAESGIESAVFGGKAATEAASVIRLTMKPFSEGRNTILKRNGV